MIEATVRFDGDDIYINGYLITTIGNKQIPVVYESKTRDKVCAFDNKEQAIKYCMENQK